VKEYKERGIKARVLTFKNYWFWAVDISGLKFLGNVAYQYTGVGVKTQPPRLLNFTAKDFQLNVAGRAHDVVGDALRMSAVEISKNTFKNSDCMMDVTKLGLGAYSRFVLDRNQVKGPEGGDNTGAIIRFYFGQSLPLSFEDWTVTGNRLGLGPVIDLDYTEEPKMQKSQQVTGLKITNGLYGDNISTGKAALFVLDHDLPWLRIEFRSVTLSGNIGTLTNDFFARNIWRLDFVRSAWRQQPGQSTLPESSKKERGKIYCVRQA
jgi:hypothetical protein